MKKMSMLSLPSRALALGVGTIPFLLSGCGGGGSGKTPAAAQAVLASTVGQGNGSGEAGPGAEGYQDDAAPPGEIATHEEQPEAPAEAEDESAPRIDHAASEFALAGYPTAPGSKAPAPAPVHASAQNLYVSPTGSDANPGTSSRPFKSLAKAGRMARAGSIVHVAPGVYPGGFRTSASGTPGARIYYVSTSRWGARIVPPPKSVNKTAWDNRGSHVDIVGFEVDGSAHQSGTRWTHGIYNGGSYVMIRNNHVHHLALEAKCTSGGGSAIGVDSYYHGVASDVIGNLVHDIGPAGCHFIQGIYISTSGSVKNNVVYRVAEAGIHLWHDARNVVITNNTVTASNTGIIVGGGNFYHTSGPNDYTAVYSNIIYGNRMGVSEQGRTGEHNTYRNNLVYQNTVFNWKLKNGLTHSDTVASPPLFAENTRDDALNLKLSASSPAIGRATPEHAASTDFEGRARDASTGFDIGAYQH
jgi:hypothetical protein